MRPENFTNDSRYPRWCALLAFTFLSAASANEIFPEDLVWWWPENIVDAARIYQCSPATSRETRDSVMVWTDASNKVVAFGSALEGGRIPPYAMALASSGGPDAMQSVRVAAKGHLVISTKKTHVLKLKETRLGCIPSVDG
jgi:hypothetical protein